MPLLTTKLYVPPPRPDLVLRTRLIRRLNAGAQNKLTLISAPAGFGKTTLIDPASMFIAISVLSLIALHFVLGWKLVRLAQAW
jgi:hypothetical protein